MSQPEPAPTDSAGRPHSRALLRRLAELARPGATAVECAPGDGALIRLKAGVRARSTAPLRLAAAELSRLAADGWITPTSEDPQTSSRIWLLTESGRTRLRDAVLARSSPKPAPRRRSGRRAALAGTPAHRPPLLEQLHGRRDARGARLIAAEHVAAGQRLAEDFHRACLQPRVTQSWDAAAFAARTGFSGRGGVGERDASAQAHARVQRALEAVGSDLAGLVVDVCCFDIGLKDTERDRHWSEGTARIVLRHALQRLAEHYGLIVRRPPDIGRYIRHWADGTHRPGAERWLGGDGA